MAQALVMDRQAERGSLALFGIMMAVVFMTVGGISIELWNVLSQRRQLTSVADSAVAAGATAIDEDAYRIDGTLELIPDLARQRAGASLAGAELATNNPRFLLQATPELVSVQASAEVDLILLSIIGAEPLSISVVASASPFQGN